MQSFHRQNTPFPKELRTRHKILTGSKNKNSGITGSDSESESDKEDGVNNNNNKLIGKMFVRPGVS